MAKQVRAKLTCISIEGEHVKFSCHYDAENTPEDNSFSKYTPWGNAEFGITNPDAMELFAVGKKYYFDIVEVPSEEKKSNEQESNEGGEGQGTTTTTPPTGGGSQPPPDKERP